MKRDQTKAKTAQDNINQKIGTVQERINDGKERVADIRAILKELYPAKNYVAYLEKIHKVVFNSNGPVTKTLRS